MAKHFRLTMNRTPCPRCHGTGKRAGGLIPDEIFTCRRCGGLGWQPTGPEPVWFYRPRQKRRDGGVYAGTERVAVMQRWAGQWRLTSFDHAGPVFHRLHTDPGELMDDLVGYIATPVAARMVDFWATRPAWADGLKMMEQVRRWNEGQR